MGGWSDGHCEIHISTESFVDREERERLGWKLSDFQKYYRKCKRNKIKYKENEAIKKVCWFEPTNIDYEIAHRVGMYGNKATIDGLHDQMHEWYRNSLLKKMIELGWEEHRAKYWIWKDWKMLLNNKEVKDES